ncbi:ABC transporter ATP-binding protein [Caldilinea sp.]|uniref:ABC transporter ATP-binding protein n=1 Tax=Caldilinea sp. TaxID=2293560 RepID=UPI002CF5177B|nr:ABC transporter ATP-binding protein [Anaerolineales bacterium]HQY92229.1 ABC transporter ATP-binding protein [Caldilinea sp.]HRA68403.1 ABC transporter ATP-binding protein [Caldilinea sp.]
MAEPFILCDGLVKIYKIAGLEQVALRELNLSVQPGELMAIVGASGSGKTTLMNILGGLDRPSAGRVLVDKQDLLRMSDGQLNRYRRERVGFIWQQSTRNLIPYLNAIDNVVLPMTVAGKMKRSRQHAAELLTLVGLGNRMHHRLSELSGGEQQRVAIAVGLANDPPLLLADEPTGEVDTATAELIYNTFRTLTREMGVTTIIVSHDPGVARQVDRVVAIRDGMLASETVRQTVVRTPEWLAENGHAASSEHHAVTFEEWVVLDKAGRVHIPPEYLEQVQIRGRARLEVTADGILIRPAEDGAERSQVVVAETVTETQKSGGLRGLFGRRPGKKT